MNRRTIEHCASEIARLQGEIAMFENTLRLAQNDLAKANLELEEAGPGRSSLNDAEVAEILGPGS